MPFLVCQFEWEVFCKIVLFMQLVSPQIVSVLSDLPPELLLSKQSSELISSKVRWVLVETFPQLQADKSSQSNWEIQLWAQIAAIGLYLQWAILL